MKNVSDYEHARDDSLRLVEPVKIFVVVRHRNAYYGYQSRQYRDAYRGFATSVIDAKRLAEGWRAPGSAFAIEEVAALLLGGEKSKYLLFDYQSPTPFSEWRRPAVGGLRLGMPLLEALLNFWFGGSWRRAPEVDSLIRVILAPGDKPEVIRPSTRFYRWESSPGRTGNHMVWSGKPSGESSASVVRIARTVKR